MVCKDGFDLDKWTQLSRTQVSRNDYTMGRRRATEGLEGRRESSVIHSTRIVGLGQTVRCSTGKAYA